MKSGAIAVRYVNESPSKHKIVEEEEEVYDNIEDEDVYCNDNLLDLPGFKETDMHLSIPNLYSTGLLGTGQNAPKLAVKAAKIPKEQQKEGKGSGVVECEIVRNGSNIHPQNENRKIYPICMDDNMDTSSDIIEMVENTLYNESDNNTLEPISKMGTRMRNRRDNEHETYLDETLLSWQLVSSSNEKHNDDPNEMDSNSDAQSNVIEMEENWLYGRFSNEEVNLGNGASESVNFSFECFDEEGVEEEKLVTRL